MKFEPHKRHRRSLRLPEYDYSQLGAYFVTVCTHNRQALFGDVVAGEMELKACGRIVVEEWFKTGRLRPRIRLDAFVVMPNHVHGIIVIADGRGTLQRAPTKTVEKFGQPTSDSLPTIVRLFKSATTTRINRWRGRPGVAVWQRNYYEHIIRDEAEWGRIREYIETNPANWAEDGENPNGQKKQ